MSTHAQLSEGSVRAPIWKGREGKGSGSLIHASRLTSSGSRPVDNATAPAAPDRLAWMDLRSIGGGLR